VIAVSIEIVAYTSVARRYAISAFTQPRIRKYNIVMQARR
jgi:hypothetical protein